jgi:hypothetical protein
MNTKRKEKDLGEILGARTGERTWIREMRDWIEKRRRMRKENYRLKNKGCTS